jgi:hypothetical protein
MLSSGLGRGSRFRALATCVVVAALLIVQCCGCTAAFGATTISVSSLAAGLGDAGAGCTLRDALVVADLPSNPALGTRTEPGGRSASRDCRGRISGRGAPYKIRLAAGAVYTLTAIDDYWFGPDGLPPISAAVTIVGNGATITRATASPTPRFRFFYVSGGLSGIPAGHLTLEHVILSNGLAAGGTSGGGGGGAGMGGAIFNQGVVTLEHVTLSGNEAQGATGSSPMLDGSGGGIGPDGGFGGSAPGAHGGAGGAHNADLSGGQMMVTPAAGAASGRSTVVRAARQVVLPAARAASVAAAVMADSVAMATMTMAPVAGSAIAAAHRTSSVGQTVTASAPVVVAASGAAGRWAPMRLEPAAVLPAAARRRDATAVAVAVATVVSAGVARVRATAATMDVAASAAGTGMATRVGVEPEWVVRSFRCSARFPRLTRSCLPTARSVAPATRRPLTEPPAMAWAGRSSTSMERCR